MADETNQTTVWYTLSDETAAQQLEVNPAQGLSTSDVEQRLGQYGPNVLA